MTVMALQIGIGQMGRDAIGVGFAGSGRGQDGRQKSGQRVGIDAAVGGGVMRGGVRLRRPGRIELFFLRLIRCLRRIRRRHVAFWHK